MIRLIELLTERRYQSVSWVSSYIDSVKDEIIGNDLSNIEIADILNKKFQSKRIKFEDSPSFGEPLRDSWAEVGITKGFIYSDGTIGIGYDSNFWETFEDDYLWDNFKNIVSSIIAHELTHRDQFIKMLKNANYVDSSNSDINSEYLSHPKEIQAFAREAVEDYMQLGYSVKDILQLLRTAEGGNIRQASKEESDAFWYYYDYFQGNEYGNRKVWNKFLKYMYEYLQQINEK